MAEPGPAPILQERFFHHAPGRCPFIRSRLAETPSGWRVLTGDTRRPQVDAIEYFSEVPAIVGTLTGYDDMSQDTQDSILFPYVTTASATAKTGDCNGKVKNYSFSFIVTGLA